MLKAEDLLEKVTTEDVIEILAELGSDYPTPDRMGNLYFNTVCHCGDSKKLHYFADSKGFNCYTSCGTMSLYDLIMNVENIEFKEAFNWVANFIGVNLHKRGIGLQESRYRNEDFDFLDKQRARKQKDVVLTKHDEKILEVFSLYYPDTWHKEGITEEIASHFGIRFCFNRYAAIIPHHDIDGNLIGIRSRNFLKRDIDAGRKYIPVTIQGELYNHPTSHSLYGIDKNKDNIKRLKKAVLYESEKSVLLHGSYFGQENNIAVASLGMNLSLYQRDLLLSLGIEEIVICFDKQYQVEYIDEEHKGTKEYLEFVRYVKTLIRITKMFIGYCNVSIVLSWGDELDYKSAPIDHGKEVFEELYRNRYMATIEELEELIE